MFGAIGSMLPLLLVVVIIWFFAWRAKKRIAKLPPEVRLVGPNGWLAWYVVTSSIFGPLVMASRLMTALTDAETKTPGLENIPAWSTYKAVDWAALLFYVAWLWWVNYGLSKRFVPSSVRRVKFFLVTAQLALVAIDWTAGMQLFGVNTLAEQ